MPHAGSGLRIPIWLSSESGPDSHHLYLAPCSLSSRLITVYCCLISAGWLESRVSGEGEAVQYIVHAQGGACTIHHYLTLMLGFFFHPQTLSCHVYTITTPHTLFDQPFQRHHHCQFASPTSLKAPKFLSFHIRPLGSAQLSTAMMLFSLAVTRRKPKSKPWCLSELEARVPTRRQMNP